MLFRGDRDGVIAIPQPSHAWLSGQMVRAWGNEVFARPAPYEDVCLGAEQHDVGWLDWEAAPTLNARTGRPHEFREVGTAVHTQLWTRGVRLALAFGRYPALLVSLHANTIYESFFDFAKAAPEDADTARRFLTEQRAFQAETLRALAADPRYRAATAPEAVTRNRLLVGVTDRMSLEICWGVTDEVRIPNVPTTDSSRTELRIRPRNHAGDLSLDPWPFAETRVDLVCEGRRLRGRFSDEADMRRALEAAESVMIETVLRPG